MQGLEINRWSLRRPDETGLVNLMSASTGIAVIRWFAQQRQGCAVSGRSLEKRSYRPPSGTGRTIIRIAQLARDPSNNGIGLRLATQVEDGVILTHDGARSRCRPDVMVYPEQVGRVVF